MVSRLMRLGLALVLVFVSAGCGATDTGLRRDEAAELARRYLDSLTTRRPELGWSLILPHDRERWGDFNAYRSFVLPLDLDSVEVEALETLYCDDGVDCVVCLQLQGGRESVPGGLRSPSALGSECGDASMHVRLSRVPWEAPGVSIVPAR